MPTRLLELGATHLLELGAAQLLELGSVSAWTGSTPVPEAIRSVYSFVETFEDPLAATGISDDELTPEALSIVNRIRAVNRRVRNSMGSGIQLGDIAGYDDTIQLGYALHEAYLGKNIFKRAASAVKRIHKTIAKKVTNVVKSPAFLSIAAIVVNVIPGVGQAASFALAAAAASRKIYAAKVDEAKAKRAQKKQTAAEMAEFLKQVKDYNAKTQEYYQSANYPVPLGQLIDADGNPTNDPSKAPGISYPININGTIFQGPPVAAVALPGTVNQAVPTQQQLNQAAAIPAAMALNNGQGAAQASSILHSFPPDEQRQIAAEVPEIQRYVNDPSFKPTSLKAIGQFVAMAEFDRGAGTGIMTPEQLALADAVKANASDEVLKAIEAGRQALFTSAAIDGPDAVKAVQQAVADGSSTGPSLGTIGLIGLGLAVLGGGVYALTRGD